MPPKFLTSTHDGRTFVISTQEPLFIVAEVRIFEPHEKIEADSARQIAATGCLLDLPDGSALYLWPLKKLETSGHSMADVGRSVAERLREMAQWYAAEHLRRATRSPGCRTWGTAGKPGLRARLSEADYSPRTGQNVCYNVVVASPSPPKNRRFRVARSGIEPPTLGL